MATYRNPWHQPHSSDYGPAQYVTDAKPSEYRGHLIYQRLPNCFDVVRNDECITQRAGLCGARSAIDTFICREDGVNVTA